ncbi:MAG: response regulator [Planctomycetota bacterium]|jgi:CheY-like chemotaxis protein
MKRVLIVDDERLIRRSLKRVLQAQGADVTEASGGKQALLLLDKLGKFDILLTDIEMPGMDGEALLRKARTLYPDTEMFVSSANVVRLEELCQRDLADGGWPKGTDTQKLVELLGL